MEKQLIVSVSREYGSGGHHIAIQLAERLGIQLVDYDVFYEMAKAKGIDLHKMRPYDETRKKPLLHRTVRGMSNSPEEALAEMQFEFMRHKAESGESFVIVGRCAETILKDYEGLVSFFITGDLETKIKRIEEVRSFNREDAAAAIKRHDKNRKAYHNYYSDMKWGDSRNYDMCINSSRIGLDKTTDVIENYIRSRVEV